MSLAEFTFTDRARPVVELGIGDSRIPTGQARWDVQRWDAADARWSGDEPTWLDVTCFAVSAECTYGRSATTDRFVAGTATVLVDNSTGWADPNLSTQPGVLSVRPGRPIRVGIDHAELGRRWLFRGFLDGMTPRYDAVDADQVQFDCVDALGEVNRAKLVGLAADVGAGEGAATRVARILDAAKWPAAKRDLHPSGVALLGTDLGGQVADLLGVAAESVGGAIYGDLNGSVAFRSRDWQSWSPTTPPDATIGNVDDTDVCPTSWTRPFERSEIATRVIVGRAGQDPTTYLQVDDIDGQTRYGIEPFERTYLLTASDSYLAQLASYLLRTRGWTTAPRVHSVALNAATETNTLDLMATVDVYKPSRYRCRLLYPPPHGLVFDDQYLATGVHHRLDPASWTLDLSLDVAAPYVVTADSRWDWAVWDGSQWAA